MMKEALTVKFKLEWKKLHTDRVVIDHEIAKLSHEIRKQFADGEQGRCEAVDWFTTELGRTTKSARHAVEAGEAWSCVRSVEHWIAVGGMASARLIVSLAPKHRLVVIAEAVALADQRGRPLSTAKVRDIAWKRGLIEREPAKITEARRAATLMAFVNRLYATVPNLPPLPPQVRALVKVAGIATAKKAA